MSRAAAPAVSEFHAGLPAWLDQVVLRALAKEPGDRFPSAVAMESSLWLGRREAADLPTVRIAAPGETSAGVQRGAGQPGGGGRPVEGGGQARRVPRGYAVVLATLFVLAILGLAWGLAVQAGGPASPPLVAPSPASPTPAASQAPARATVMSTVPPATPTTAAPRTPTAMPTPAAPTAAGATPRQMLDRVRALVANSPATAWEKDKKRDFLKRLEDLDEKLAEDKPRDTRDRLQDLTRRASELAREGDLDGRLADQIIAQLRALESQL